MKKLGILVENLGFTQLSYFAIKNSNTILAKNIDKDIIIFYQTLVKPCLLSTFATMTLVDAHDFDGNCIATNLSTADFLLTCPSIKKKFFYVWDLEWTRSTRPFSMYQRIYSNPELTLIARSESHKNIIESCWNKSVAFVMDDFNLENEPIWN